jgi:hypothetical protein
MLPLHQGLQKLSMQGQQLLETWWLPGFVVAMVIGVADSVFCHQKSRGGCATISKGIEGEKGNPTRMDRDKDGLIDSQTKSLLYNPKGLCV